MKLWQKRDVSHFWLTVCMFDLVWQGCDFAYLIFFMLQLYWWHRACYWFNMILSSASDLILILRVVVMQRIAATVQRLEETCLHRTSSLFHRHHRRPKPVLALTSVVRHRPPVVAAEAVAHQQVCRVPIDNKWWTNLFGHRALEFLFV